MATILVVEDDQDIRDLFRKILRRCGYRVTVSCDGEEALRLFHQHPFDLVITDIIMPQKDGIELIREIKNLDAHVKIIAISGGGSRPDCAENYISAARRLGAARTFKKPFSADQILDAVKVVMNEL